MRQRLGREKKWERILFVPCSLPDVFSAHLLCRREHCGQEVGGQSRPMGQWETDSREGPPIPQGSALIGGALQLSDNDSSSLVMHNSQRLRYCHNKHIH